MNRDQRSWFNEVLKGRNLVWSEVRSIIVKTYAAQDVAQELEYMDQLLSLKMVPAESIEAFTDRFQRIRRAATVGQKTAARNCKIPVLQLVFHGYCTKLSQILTVCTSMESAFIRRLSDMGNGYWWNLRSLKVVL
ncbi:hypothetical protein G6F51_013889 [Rhizopus arrhizus]|nr:hypothetical protein G6F51_013889 [Rhizopus arrhizus]